MDRFGFKDVARKMKQVERSFIVGSIKMEQEVMSENFDSESSSGVSWYELTYRDVPPPILDLEGKLKDEAINGNPIILGSVGVLEIDPVDSRGKGYADYHQQGGLGESSCIIYNGNSGNNKLRPFMTQPSSLDKKQKSLLIDKLNKAFL